jgi:DNA-binding PadR family transcriptional regulator
MYGHRHSGGERRYARHGFGLGGRLGGHQRGGRGGRLGRVFDQGDLRYVLLHLITEKPSHGYELIKAIEEKFSGMYSPSPGIVYPNLNLLEELGYLRSAAAAEGTRKLYTVTAEGTNYLAANRAAVDAIFVRIAEISRAYGGGPAPEIQRAMRNLETALSIRLGKDRST